MRRVVAAFAVLAACSLLFLPTSAAPVTDVPGTPVRVLDLGPTSRTVSSGDATNFTWAIFNGGPPPYAVNVTANSSDPSFRVTVFPASFVVARDGLREVVVNVTAPDTSEARVATIRVRFETLSPMAAYAERNVTVAVRTTLASVGVLTAFLAIAAIIAIGFAATLIFERTRVPDLLILIFLGLLLGPISVSYFGIAFVPPGVLEIAAPYFTALALMFILFDGGLNLRISHVVKNLGLVGLHTGTTFLLTVFGVAFVTTVLLGYDWLVALLLGVVLGGTSGAVVIGIVRALRVSEETKTVLTLESVLTDVLCVVTVLALIELLRSGPGASMTIVFTDLGQAFAVSLAFGVAAGIAWLLVLRRVERKPFSYMLTIAVLFGVYGMAEVSGGSGAMAAFVFGLVLGNHASLSRRLRIHAQFVIDDRIKQFHSELAFVIRTFFFVFLGIVFTLQFGGGWRVATALPLVSALNGTFLLFFLGVLAVFAVILLVRVVTARIVTSLRPKPPAERRILWSLMGRGLAAAVLAALPFTIPAFTDPTGGAEEYYRATLAPYQTQFANLAFFIILLTVGATTVGVALSERTLGRAPRPGPLQGIDAESLAVLRGMDLDELEVSDRPPTRLR